MQGTKYIKISCPAYHGYGKNTNIALQVSLFPLFL